MLFDNSVDAVVAVDNNDDVGVAVAAIADFAAFADLDADVDVAVEVNVDVVVHPAVDACGV